MSEHQDDIEFLARRAQQERELAASSRSPLIASLHRDMALAYERLATGLEPSTKAMPAARMSG